MTGTIILLIVLIALSAFFSAAETAFSSMNKIRLKALANNGDKRAQKTLDISEDFTRLLSTILICNNIVNIVSTSLATVLFVALFPSNGVFISSLVMTIIVVVFCEVIPKSLAKSNPEKFAMSITPIISFFMLILRPITALLSWLEKGISKLFKTEGNDQFSSEELITMVEEAQDDNEISESEADLITNAVEFNDLDVGEILTPRIDVVAVDINKHTPDDIDLLYRESGYSRLPVYEGSIDNVIGLLLEKDFYHLFYTNKNGSLKRILKNVVYTSPHVKISSLLKQLQAHKTHLAVVVDEYGGTAGIITMEDILEELVGEIYDEHDYVVEYYKKLDDYTYLVSGELDIDDMFERFNLEKDDEEYDFNTTSAWVISKLEKIPEVGESFRYKNITVEVTDADSKVVNEIKITFDKEESKTKSED